MTHPPEARAAVRAAYVYDRLSIGEAATRAGVGERTARTWKSEAQAAGDDWDRARAAAQMAGDSRQMLVQALLEDYIRLHQSTQDALLKADVPALAKAEALSRLADAFGKTMSAVGRAAPQLSALAIAGEVVQELARFVQQHHPEAAPALLEVLEPFGDHIAKKYA